MDGDGLPELLVSAHGYDGVGAGFLFLGSTLAGQSQVNLADADWAFTGEAADDYMTYAMSAGGDADGDGLPDLLMVAFGNDEGGTDAGKAYLYLTP